MGRGQGVEKPKRGRNIWAARWSEWLNSELDSRGWRPADLVRASGIKASRISNWRHGTIRPTVESCNLVADALNLERDFVLNQAGYFLVKSPSRDPWQECFGVPVPKDAQSFLIDVYNAWKKNQT